MTNKEAIAEFKASYCAERCSVLLENNCCYETECEVYIAISALETIDRIKAERDAAVDDLEKCMYYARPKNNNVCNFCEKDMSEYPDKCNGWSGFCECEPKWKGVADDIEQEKA